MHNLRCWVEIDRKVIANNIRLLRTKLSESTSMLVVVKGDAYGHGIVESSKIAASEGASHLGVAYLDEALEISKGGIKIPILLLTQPDLSDIPMILRFNIIPTIYDYAFASLLSKKAKQKKKNVKVHVKIDTGFNRLGIKHTNAIKEIEKIYSLPYLNVDGYYTHYASAASKNLSAAERQLEIFMNITSELKKRGMEAKYLHTANSASFVWIPRSQLNLVRLGMAVFGLQPSKSKIYPLPIKCGITWKTRVLQVKYVGKGECVGYDGSWKATKKTKIASIAVGYADGFRLDPKNFGYVLCGGVRSPILGKVSMSVSTIKVDPSIEVKVGDEVVIMGSQGKSEISPEDITLNTGSSNEEIVTNISKSLPRIFL